MVEWVVRVENRCPIMFDEHGWIQLVCGLSNERLWHLAEPSSSNLFTGACSLTSCCKTTVWLMPPPCPK
jgi:hypothetical protein